MPFSLVPRAALVAVLAALPAPCAKKATPIGDCGVSASAPGDVSQPGPFNVGYRSFPVTYTVPAEPGTRTILVNVWYPTTDKGGVPATYVGIFPDPNSWVNASLAPPLSSCGYPVVEFSHGDRAWGGSSAYMMQHFASHGWVGIAPDHTGDTFADNDGEPHPESMYIERPLDMMKSLDAVGALKAPDPLAGKVALDRVILVGHSYGTYDVWSLSGATYSPTGVALCPAETGVCTPAENAVLEAGFRDPRVIASISEAGVIDISTMPNQAAFFGTSGELGVHIPLLQMTGGANDVGQYTNWPLMQNTDMSWVDIADACHETFNTGACSPVPPDLTQEQGYDIVRPYQLAFARYHLLGDRSAQVSGIVNGTIQVSDLVTFKSR